MAKNILICDDAAFMRMMIKDNSDQERLQCCRRSRERNEGSGEVQGSESRSGSDGHHHA